MIPLQKIVSDQMLKINGVVGYLGNPVALSIAIIIALIIVLAIAMVISVFSNKWKLFCSFVVLIMIAVPVFVAGYEWCRSKSIDNTYSRKTQSYNRPPPQIFGAAEIEPDRLSDVADLDDWFAQ